MAEKLLSISEVKLYGQKVADMAYGYIEKRDEKNRQFARVFGFGFEGNYYDLDAPIIMLVGGEGEVISKTSPPTDVENAFSPDTMVWSCDKSDSSIRMDTLTGTFEEILLEVELGGGGARVSGGRVSGGRVSGGRVSGGRVSGGKDD